MSDIGVAGRDGVILAVEEVNRQGGIAGRMVELIIKNDKQDPEVARQGVRQMTEAGVVGIVGPMTSSMALAIMPLADELQTLVISPTASTNELTGKDDYFFRVYSANANDAKNLAELAYSKRGYRRVAVIYDLSNRGYTENLFQFFKQYFEEHGGSIIQAVSYTTRKDTDFSLLATQLSESSPDSIYIIAGARDTAMICQQLVKQGKKIPILASEWSVTDDVLHYGGMAVEGMEFFHSYDRNSKKPAFLDFKEKYNNRFHRDPEFASIRSYEATRVLLTSLEKAGDLGKMPEAIVSTGRFKGLQSDIVFDRYGDVQRPYILKTIKNGVFTAVLQ